MKNRQIFAILILVFIFLSSSTLLVHGQTDYPSYEIQPGDSLGIIAERFGTTIEAIITVNSLSNPDFISPGQTIYIPSYPGLNGALLFAATDLGDFYSILPVKYQMESSSFTQMNSVLSPAQLYAGSELILLITNDQSPLIPVNIIEEAQTELEMAARINKNPYALMLQNMISGPGRFLPGTVIFRDEESEYASLDLFFPSLSDVSINPLPLNQGGTEVIKIKSNHPVTLSGFIGELPLQFFILDNKTYYALQGIHALQEPGLVDFSISTKLNDGSTQTYSQQVLVKPGNFDEDPPLTVDPSTIDPSITDPENELVYSLISQISPTKYWQNIFISPAVYQEYNSLFGTRRKYNDDPTIYFHTGVDFAGGMTLPITAPAAGKVVFAGPLTVRGNTVFIDHGWGIFSGFFHQDTILVNTGDFVESGQQIGTVGNSGRVNKNGDYYGVGAHLHWELWVNRIQVNPLDWLYYEYP